MTRSLLLSLFLLAAPAAAQDFAGAWTIQGSDPGLGAYAGHAVVTRSGNGWAVARLVELTNRLPDGRVLALSWAGTGRTESGGLRVEAELLRCEFVSRLGAITRGPADRVPLRISALLSGGPLAFSGSFGAPGVAGQETWTRAAGPGPSIPLRAIRLDPVPSTLPRALLRLFAPYHRLPHMAPYASRPEFQAAVHFQVVDETGKAWTRAHPDRLLVVQKVPDELARIEEELRTRAFRSSLAEKARGFGEAMVRDHVEASTGMLGGRSLSSGARVVHGDSALHQGVWVASQVFRHRVTGDPQALANVELGTRALCLMVDAPGNPAEFARAVGEAATADPTWARSTAVPGIAYIPGGNNDMMHGISYGFGLVEHVLPAGHPRLAEIGIRANQLVQHQKSGQRAKHKIVLSGVAARLSGDPGAASRYRRALWAPLELLWTFLGEGLWVMPEISGRSGPHLGTTTFVKLHHLGGPAGPSHTLERIWRAAAARGVRVAFEKTRANRPGNLALVVTLVAGNVPGATEIGKSVLAELPYPDLTGPIEVDWTIDPGFCASPWPFLPWKGDFMTNPGRMQSLVTYPLWSHVGGDNWWKEGPNYSPLKGGAGDVIWSRQDYLHAYWVGRASGAISATD